jgi:hypothetical protein
MGACCLAGELTQQAPLDITGVKMKMNDVDFLIIGATKSATTWLQRSLQKDPNILMPDPELHFFSREFHRGENWYLAQFPTYDGEQLVGEKSNSYLEEPLAASRIYASLHNAKLIAQLRNPIDRAYSDYCMLFRRGDVTRDIAQYLDPRHAEDNRFLGSGCYYKQLERYYDLFPAHQLLVLLYEDLIHQPDEQLRKVRKYLGAIDEGNAVPISERIKDKNKPIVGGAHRKYLSWLKPIASPFRKTRAFKAAKQLFAQRIEYSPLSQELSARLVEYYSEDSEKLGKLIGRDLSMWLESGREPVSNSSS